MRCVLNVVAVCLAALMLLACLSASETRAASPFGTPGATEGRGPPIGAQPSGGLFGSGPFAWVMRTQSALHKNLAQAILRFKSERAFASAFGLAMLSFGYGVLHAVGPGHGKAVITSYVVGNEQTVRRGIALSFAAAVVQALAAILLVGVLAVMLNTAGFEIQAWSNTLETASYALIMAVGAGLLISQVRAFRARRAAVAPRALEGEHADHHGHDRAHHRHNADDDDHAHAGDHGSVAPCGHDHDHHEGCRHAHMPDPRLLAGPVSLNKMAAIVLAVGIRPCTGAILVLIFALAQGLFWAGVAATFAMALGTAITVSALAALAMGSRQLALRFANGSSGWTETIWSVCGIGGATLVLMLGAILFVASLGPARPL